jgi:hypothetical protein
VVSVVPAATLDSAVLLVWVARTLVEPVVLRVQVALQAVHPVRKSAA